MPTFGVTIIAASGSIVESIDVESKGEFKQLITSVGLHSEAKIFDVSHSVSVKGKGDTCPFVAGTSSGMPTGVSGKGIWTNASVESKNDDYRGWSASATIYQGAS
jgi:hypothetical protein